MTSPETLRSILIGEPWYWHYGSSQITFHENGTGVLLCSAELSVWIAAEFDWKLLSNPDCLDQIVDLDSKARRSEIISELNVEITLTARQPPGYNLAGHTLNEALLTDQAFMPKSYNLKLEQGRFVTQFDTRNKVHSGDQFALRLAFDPSPFPPGEEWKQPNSILDVMKFWEWTDFASRRLPDKEPGLWDRFTGLFQG
ncbi:hypothetical protein BO71DRAFT_365034 [Aspergillus ellipticus CBS 707.79]|uniref:Uncharacterized protein n=1 Tax=Aspergillus ellipticus CBS 707.79 TaxID=1448320 RepID=A0A319EBZ1_9EURO|nr:hypothetical protein BO71DRAFT_365034 [Aspergillus ellipticus CBS 707.79]